jgi:hypothetical protein
MTALVSPTTLRSKSYSQSIDGVQIDVSFLDSFNTQIFGINDQGELVGLYRTPLQAEFGFVGTPSPTLEPATLLLWGTTMAGVGVTHCRRRGGGRDNGQLV